MPYTLLAEPEIFADLLERSPHAPIQGEPSCDHRRLAIGQLAEVHVQDTKQSIGEDFGLSKERVRQIQNSALDKLREVLDADIVLQ